MGRLQWLLALWPQYPLFTEMAGNTVCPHAHWKPLRLLHLTLSPHWSAFSIPWILPLLPFQLLPGFSPLSLLSDPLVGLLTPSPSSLQSPSRHRTMLLKCRERNSPSFRSFQCSQWPIGEKALDFPSRSTWPAFSQPLQRDFLQHPHLSLQSWAPLCTHRLFLPGELAHGVCLVTSLH